MVGHGAAARDYQKGITVALRETIRDMSDIAAVIPQWPLA